MWKLFNIKNVNINDVNGVFLVSLLLTVNIFQTLFQLLTVDRQTLAWFISNRQTHLKTKSGISCLTYYLKCEQIFLTNSIWTYTITTLWVNQWEIIAKEFTSEHDSGKKKMQLTFKITCCMYICLFTDFAC